MNDFAEMPDVRLLAQRPDIEEMIETLAAKVHESWVQQRRAEGWTWGKTLDPQAKKHPSFITYDQLPENEKEIDRGTVRNVIQGLLDLRCEIHSPQAKPAPDTRNLAPLLQELQGAAAIPLSRLSAIWNQCCFNPDCPAEIHLSLGERMLKQGEAILAYDVLSHALAALEQHHGASATRKSLQVRITQLLALALAQSGASERARDLLLKIHQQGSQTPETLGLLGRVSKDLAAQARSPAERARWLEQSFQDYFSGFSHADADLRLRGEDGAAGDVSYCGINAATLALLLNRPAQAQQLAQRVKTVCTERLRRAQEVGEKADYWLTATIAEAELISGNHAAAEAAYRAANQLVEGNWRELSSTRRQARLLAQPLGLESRFVEQLFPAISVAVFAAPVLAGPVSQAEMLDWEKRLKENLTSALAEAGVVCAYATASSPADLLFIETMLATQREIQVILPCPRQDGRQIFQQAPAWAARYDDVLSRVPWVTEDTQPSSLDPSINRVFARQRVHGAGILRAQRLDAELHVWPKEGLAFPYATMREEPRPESTGPIQRATDGAGGENYAIRAMLFADVKGYSKLSDAELLQFARQFMTRIAGVLAEHSSGILSRRTAGDGLFLVFADLNSAAQVALQLRDLVASTPWEECQLPANLGIRISLDAGPVYVFQDPVTRRDEVCGLYVNRAARIEPITPPNQVYASQAFAALHVASSAQPLRFDYVGQIQLPKGFGLTPLYCCQPGR